MPKYDRPILRLKPSKEKINAEKARLCNEWLKTFPVFQQHVLMAIGIRHQLRAQYDSLEGRPFPWNCVNVQLKGRVGKLWYKKLIWKGAMRYNLDGSEAGWMNPMPRKKQAPEKISPPELVTEGA